MPQIKRIYEKICADPYPIRFICAQTPVWYNSPPEQEGKGHYQRSRQHPGIKTKSTAAHRKAVHSTHTSRPDRHS